MATINGTGDPDVLVGTDDADIIDGLGGNDTISGRGSNDELRGSDGDDRLIGEGGADTLLGGDGDDTLEAGDGDVLADGGAGIDLFKILFNAIGQNFELDVSDPTAERVFLGTTIRNVERLDYRGADFGGGSHRVTGGAYADSIYGANGDDVLRGGGGNDFLNSGIGGADELFGDAGDDVLEAEYGGTGAIDWVLDGGDGFDRVSINLGFFDGVFSLDLGADANIRNIEHIDYFGGSAASVVAAVGGDDTLLGGDKVDWFDGGGGNDSIQGNGGADVLRGGAGNDVLSGGRNDDTLTGGAGADTLSGGSETDTVDYSAETGGGAVQVNLQNVSIFGQSGLVLAGRQARDSFGDLDSLSGIENVKTGAGADSVYGDEGANRIETGAGNDFLLGREGADTLLGGPGDDVYSILTAYGPNEDTVVELDGEGTDEIRTDFAVFSLAGIAHVENLAGFNTAGQTLTGNDLGNLIRGWLGNDVLDGGAGNDTLSGGAGADTMRGGADNDVYIVDNAGDVVEENADAGTDEVRTALGAGASVEQRIAAQYQLGANLENLTGLSGGGQGLRGNTLANVVAGGSGDDVLNLADGGNDTANGGGGNDVLFYGGALTSADANDGGSGTDTLVLQGTYASLVLGASSLVAVEGISIQSGTITRWGQSGANSYDYSLTMAEANTAPGQQLRVNAQSLTAGEDFVFNGGAENDGGRFLVYAGFGVDQLTGGAGNDVFFFEAGRLGAGDVVNGGGGNDAVVVSGAPAGSGALVATIASGTLTSIESLSLNGRFASDPSARPSYTLTIENGNIAAGERLIVNGSSLEGTQILHVDASQVADGRLWLFGGGYADTLTGGAGDDLIYAASGSDALRGGGGADLFQYRSVADSTPAAQDRIYDFQHGSDRIDLAMIDANSTVEGDQAFTFFAGGSFSGAPGELRALFDAGSGMWTLYGDLNGDGNAELLIEVIVEAGQPLTASDFIL